MLNKIIIWLLQRRLNRLKKQQDTPYLYIKGIGKDYPKYLMYTDDASIALKMHRIF